MWRGEKPKACCFEREKSKELRFGFRCIPEAVVSRPLDTTILSPRGKRSPGKDCLRGVGMWNLVGGRVDFLLGKKALVLAFESRTSWNQRGKIGDIFAVKADLSVWWVE